MIKKNWIESWANFVTRNRIKILFFTFLSFLLLGTSFKNLYFDNSNEMWFVKGEAALEDAKQFRNLFGNSEYLIVGVETPEGEKDVFNEKTLKMIAKITNFLEDHQFVTKVASLTKYQYMKSENDTLDVSDLIPELESRFQLEASDEDEIGEEDEPKTFVSLETMRKVMAGETLVHDFMITKDFKHTIISARTIRKENTIEHQVQITRELKQFIEQEKFIENGAKLRLSGNPVVGENFFSFSMSDQQTTYPLMFLLIILFLIFSFRSVSGLLLPLFVVVGSIVIVVGTLGVMGWAFNMLNVFLPILLMAVGIGDSVHILVEFYNFRNQGLSPADAAKAAVRALWIPCFNTTLTTAIGFLALAVSDLLPVREFGIIAAIGVFGAFLLSVTALPALLTFVKSKPEKTKKLMENGLVSRLVLRITPFTYKNKKRISVGGLLVTAVSVFFITQITIDANFVNYFKKDSVIRKDILYFDEVYNGYSNLEFILDSKNVGGIKDVRFLEQALQFQEYLEALPEAGKSNSLINFIRKMNQVMHNGDSAWYVVPDTRELVAQYLLLYENTSPDEDLSDLKSTDERYMRISLKLKNMPSSQVREVVEKIEKELSDNYPMLNGVVTGDLILFNRVELYVQKGLVNTFSLAIGLIVICLFFLLGSVRYGLLAMIPSLFPILFAGGVLSFLGIYLDFGTMIVAAVTFGIAVDDTIHVMSRYIQGRKRGKTRQDALHAAITETGRALIFTSIILYCGFSVLMLSSMMPNVYFGFFAGVIIITALLADLVLLPAVIFLTGSKDSAEKEVRKVA